MPDAERVYRLEFGSVEELEAEVARNLRSGGALVRTTEDAVEGRKCTLVVVHPASGAKLVLFGSVVWVGEQDGARVVGIALDGFGPARRDEILAFAAAGAGVEEAEEGEAEEGEADERSLPRTVYDKLRGLSSADQLRVSREGDLSERVALERIYGKSVWEPLLKNPRLTPPEVTRIARMGTLPVPLVELIVANGAWLSSPQVRRALLSNPRLRGEAVAKVLRAMPQAELRLVPKQTTYPAQVREAARRLLPK